MCTISSHQIQNLPLINKMIANRVLNEMQLAFSKAGGKVMKSDLEKMSLEHFICLCSMNQIQIILK